MHAPCGKAGCLVCDPCPRQPGNGLDAMSTGIHAAVTGRFSANEGKPNISNVPKRHMNWVELERARLLQSGWTNARKEAVIADAKEQVMKKYAGPTEELDKARTEAWREGRAYERNVWTKSGSASESKGYRIGYAEGLEYARQLAEKKKAESAYQADVNAYEPKMTFGEAMRRMFPEAGLEAAIDTRIAESWGIMANNIDANPSSSMSRLMRIHADRLDSPKVAPKVDETSDMKPIVQGDTLELQMIDQRIAASLQRISDAIEAGSAEQSRQSKYVATCLGVEAQWLDRPKVAPEVEVDETAEAIRGARDVLVQLDRSENADTRICVCPMGRIVSKGAGGMERGTHTTTCVRAQEVLRQLTELVNAQDKED